MRARITNTINDYVGGEAIIEHQGAAAYYGCLKLCKQKGSMNHRRCRGKMIIPFTDDCLSYQTIEEVIECAMEAQQRNQTQRKNDRDIVKGFRRWPCLFSLPG